MRIGVAYLRMSTDKQEFSIESQLRLIKEYAKKNGILIKEKYIDEGISGRQAEKRPAFMQMISDSSLELFECVLIYDSSRFARNLEQSIVYKSELKRNGVELISITEPTLDDDSSLITDALLGAMNEMYSRKLSKNVKRGMEQKALRGEYLSCAPLGYDRIISGKPLEINDKEAEIVKLIFQKFLNGDSCYGIARDLNKMNIKTKRGNLADRRGVQLILTNVTYKGYLSWTLDGKTIYTKADHKAIIDEETFDLVQAKHNSNERVKKHKGRPAETRKHWMIGLLKCHTCAKGYVYAKGYGGRSARFRCGGFVNATCESPSSIKVEALEKIVLNELENILRDSSLVYSSNIIEPAKIDTVSIDKEIHTLKKSLARAKEAYLEGIDTISEYGENKKILTKKLEELIKKKEVNTVDFNPKMFNDSLEEMLEVLKNDFDIVEKNKIAKTLIDRIVFDAKSKKISLYFFA